MDDIEVMTGDIRDSDWCRDATKATDIIFHLAALIPIPYSYRAPASFVETNITGTLNLCQAARANGIQRFRSHVD